MSRAGGLWAGVVVALASGSAYAQQPVRAVAFSWVRDAGADRCPPQREMMEAVRARLGRDPFSATATVSAEAVVTRIDAQWRARLMFRDARGAVLLRRELDDGSEDCATLASAVVVSVTLALDPSGEPEVSPPPARVAPPAVVTPPAPVRPAAPRIRAWTTLSVEALIGPLPGVAPGVAWRLEVPWGDRWRLWGAFALTPERRTVTPDDAWAFGMTRASLGACVRMLSAAWVDFEGCAGGALGLVHAVTFKREPVAPGNYLWPALVAEARVVMRPVRPMVFELGVSGAGVLAPDQFYSQRNPSPLIVHEQGYVSLALCAGLGAEF